MAIHGACCPCNMGRIVLPRGWANSSNEISKISPGRGVSVSELIERSGLSGSHSLVFAEDWSVRLRPCRTGDGSHPIEQGPVFGARPFNEWPFQFRWQLKNSISCTYCSQSVRWLVWALLHGKTGKEQFRSRDISGRRPGARHLPPSCFCFFRPG